MVFEMDDKGLRHTQLQKQFKKAQVLAMLTALGGGRRRQPGGKRGRSSGRNKTKHLHKFFKGENHSDSKKTAGNLPQ